MYRLIKLQLNKFKTILIILRRETQYVDVVRLVPLLFSVTPWWWHPGAETCSSFIRASKCTLFSA
jgi:hypothetical protein